MAEATAAAPPPATAGEDDDDMHEFPKTEGDDAKDEEGTPKDGGLFSPVQGKRERKPVKKIELEMTAARVKSSKVEAGEGRGVKLSEIPNIVHKLSKFTGGDEECRVAHNLLFRRAAKKPLVKKNILDFSGFVYADPVKEREKDRAKLLGYHLPVIHSLLDLFDLARGSGDAGTKDAKVDRILDFLDRPVLDGSKKNLAEAAEKKKAKAARKKKAGAKKRKRAAGAAAGRSHGGDEGEEDDDDEDDDVPLIAKLPPKLPSDAKIEAAVTDIVRGSDLNELTMKGVREQLAISFKCDVTSKKKLISTYVSAALEAMRNEGGEE